MTDPPRTIIVERDSGIVTITLNRPGKKNAATSETWRELQATFSEIDASVDDRVVVVTGAGDDFCAGADLWQSDGGPQAHGLAQMREVTAVALALHRLHQPTIAKVRGVAVGAGCNLALGCDLIVAGETARFSEIFPKRGLSLDFGGSWILPRLIGLHAAKELAFFGEMLSAQEAKQLGLVNRVLPDDELDGFVDGWARRLVNSPSIALAQSKLMLNHSANRTMEASLEAEAAAQAVNFRTTDTVEAIAAFAERRDPIFRNR